MRDLLATLDEWAATDPELGLATVVRTTGSTPRPVGAQLLVTRDGRIAGSVSGGCLEAAVILEAQATLEGSAPPRVLQYGISDELGWSVGLACGGTVDIFVETIRWDGSDVVLTAIREHIEQDRPVALLTVLEGEGAGRHAALVEGHGGHDGSEALLVGSLGGGDGGVNGALRVEGPGAAGVVVGADAAMSRCAAVRLVSGQPGIEQVAGLRVFVDPVIAQPQLVIVGAVHIAIALSRMAAAVGYTVTVIDPRGLFLTAERLPDAHRLVARWPQEALRDIELGPADAAVCLAHDPKFEDPALAALLRSRAGYVGAIGSRKTHAARVLRLAEAGFGDADIARVHSPVGLDIGAVTPAEIAVAILAEMVASRRGRGGRSLSARAEVVPVTVA